MLTLLYGPVAVMITSISLTMYGVPMTVFGSGHSAIFEGALTSTTV